MHKLKTFKCWQAQSQPVTTVLAQRSKCEVSRSTTRGRHEAPATISEAAASNPQWKLKCFLDSVSTDFGIFILANVGSKELRHIYHKWQQCLNTFVIKDLKFRCVKYHRKKNPLRLV